MLRKQTIYDVDMKGKRVLIRVDYNVPLDENQKITDDARITKSLGTLRYCLEQNAKIILMSHLGRPKGKPAAEFSLKPVAEHLSHLLQKRVELLPDCIGPVVERRVENLKARDVFFL